MRTELIKISDIEWDNSIYPRTMPDWTTIWSYQDAMKMGDTFPPILVGKRENKYIGIDGKHRYLATRKNGGKVIQAIVTKEPESQWFIIAVSNNIKHGRQLSPYEKAMIAQKLREMFRMTDSKICTTLGMTKDSLNRMLGKRLALRTRAGGTQNFDRVVLKSPFTHLAGTEVGSNIESAQKIMGVVDQNRAIEQVLNMARSDTFNLNDEYVKSMLVELYNWLRKNRSRLLPTEKMVA